MSSEDYYEIMGLKKPSDSNEIRKAYHKLALKFHPDKNNSPEAIEIFKKISEAYDVLSTSEKKKFTISMEKRVSIKIIFNLMKIIFSIYSVVSLVNNFHLMVNNFHLMVNNFHLGINNSHLETDNSHLIITR